MSKASVYAQAIGKVDEKLEPEGIHAGLFSAHVNYNADACIRTFHATDGDAEITMSAEYALMLAEWINENFGEA